jgi:hypothetical protein
MTASEIIAIVAALVSVGSMIAAFRSARIAKEAKEQAKQAAHLGPRREVIGHLHKAVADIRRAHLVVNPDAKVSIEAAKEGAVSLFSPEVNNDLGHAIQTAESLIRARVNAKVEPIAQLQPTSALVEDLQNLIERMNREAAL